MAMLLVISQDLMGRFVPSTRSAISAYTGLADDVTTKVKALNGLSYILIYFFLTRPKDILYLHIILRNIYIKLPYFT